MQIRVRKHLEEKPSKLVIVTGFTSFLLGIFFLISGVVYIAIRVLVGKPEIRYPLASSIITVILMLALIGIGLVSYLVSKLRPPRYAVSIIVLSLFALLDLAVCTISGFSFSSTSIGKVLTHIFGFLISLALIINGHLLLTQSRVITRTVRRRNWQLTAVGGGLVVLSLVLMIINVVLTVGKMPTEQALMAPIGIIGLTVWTIGVILLVSALFGAIATFFYPFGAEEKEKIKR